MFHVVSTREENNEIYQVQSLPAHDEWLHMFSFTAGQSRRSENDTMLFIYPPSSSGIHIMSTALYLNNSDRFPNDYFFAGRNEGTTDIFEFTISSNLSNKISISNQSTDCCSTVWTNTIPVVLLSGKIALAV